MNLTTALSDTGTWHWQALLLALAIGVATALLAWGAARTSSVLTHPLRRRLKDERQSHAEVTTAAVTPGRFASLWARFEPSHGNRRASSLRVELLEAGFRAPNALGVVYAAKLLFAALALVVALVGLKLAHALELYHPNSLNRLLIIAGVVYLGWLLPNLYLDRRRTARKEALMRGFPDALDLMVACTEAGLSLNGAMARVAEQMPASHPELATELALVNAEMLAGIDRAVAMRNLAERTGLTEIRGLVALITQSGRLGTGIASTLRVFAEEFRDRRMQRAEERAATISTKLIFPLVTTLWPAFFVVAVGPAIIGVLHAFANR